MQSKRRAKPILQRMRLLAMMVLISICTCQASVNGQSNRVSLNVKNLPFSVLLQQIEEQSGYMFVYKSSDIEALGKVSVVETQIEVGQLLDKYLANTNLTYDLNDNLIVIK